MMTPFSKALLASFISVFVLNQLFFGAMGLAWTVAWNTWQIDLREYTLALTVLHMWFFWPTLQCFLFVYWLNRFGFGRYLNVGFYVIQYAAFMLSFWFAPVLAYKLGLTERMELVLSFPFGRPWEQQTEPIIAHLLFLLLYGILMYFILGIHRRE